MIAPVCQLWLSVCTLFLAGLRKASMPKVPSAWRLWIWLLLCVRYLVPLPSPNLFPLAFETHFGAVPVPTLWPALRWSVTLLLFLLFLVRWARWLFLSPYETVRTAASSCPVAANTEHHKTRFSPGVLPAHSGAARLRASPSTSSGSLFLWQTAFLCTVSPAMPRSHAHPPL